MNDFTVFLIFALVIVGVGIVVYAVSPKKKSVVDPRGLPEKRIEDARKRAEEKTEP